MLCLVTDRSVSRRPLDEAVAGAVAAGVDWVQIRERDLGGAALLDLARALARAAREAARGRRQAAPLRVLVNRRADVALALGVSSGTAERERVDGVHLGFDGLPVAVARALLGDRAWIGASAHAPAEVMAAARDGATYAHLAPIFAPRSKRAQRPALGVDALPAAAAAGVPVIAQGGIDAENAGRALAAGAAGVAVTGAILMDDDPAAAAAALRAALDAARASR